MRRLALLAFLLLLYLPGLGSSSSATHPDESYYLGISAEMDAGNAWLTPTLDGAPRWFKPPLLYWAERICYALFGRGFFAGRLPSALAAVGLALVTGALARRMIRPEAALPAMLLTATCFGFVRFARIAMMDTPLTLALAITAYAVWRTSEERPEEGRPEFLLLAGLGGGVGFMLKGPVGAVLVLLVGGGFLALRRPRLLASRWTAGAFALGAAIGLPWYVLSFARHGQAFYDFFVVSQNFDRFRHPWTAGSELILLGGFLILMLPWTFLAAGAVPAWWRRLREPAVLLPVVWIGAVLFLFTIPSLKWSHYGLSCVPAVMLLVVQAEPPRWARLATAGLLALLGLAIALPLRWTLPALGGAGLVASAVLLWIAAGLVARGRLAWSAASSGLAATLVMGVVIPDVNPPVVPEAARASLAGREVCVDRYVPGIFTLGLGRPVRRCEGPEQVGRALDAGVAAILTEPALASLPEARRGQLQILLRWQHVPGYLPAQTVWRAWLAGDTAPLFEDVQVVARP
jgi:4-amino-4-deoxy-L-arabinose transferase-like glycosyltransferase